MNSDIINEISTELNVKSTQIESVLKLLEDGNTIPFIARYRKEKTGELDDQTIRSISDRLTYLRNLDERKQEVYTAILSQEKMTDENEIINKSRAIDEKVIVIRKGKKKQFIGIFE